LGFSAADDCELKRELRWPLVLVVEVEAGGGATKTLLAMLPVTLGSRLDGVVGRGGAFETSANTVSTRPSAFAFLISTIPSPPACTARWGGGNGREADEVDVEDWEAGRAAEVEVGCGVVGMKLDEYGLGGTW
jgi:hypothetical protein